MCWRLSVFLFGGREGHWNTKNRFIKDKNNLLPGGFTQSELCCVAWLNHFSREARGSLCCFEGKGQGDAAGHRISEREREKGSECAEGQLPAPVCPAGTALWAGVPHKLFLWGPYLATRWKGKWEKGILSSFVQIPSISPMEEKLL